MTDSTLRIVVALGGNALCEPGTEGNIAQQFARTRATAVHLADLVDSGHRLLITHGNGPQVGNILRRVEIASREVYPIDLGLCVADTQSSMGYMICQCLVNEFRKRGANRNAFTIVTRVVVDAQDPAFAHPTKPIGPYLSQEEAERHSREDGWHLVPVPGRGMRRVVPSPEPRTIEEMDLLKKLYDQGELLVACGGGGIPVIDRPGWGYEGVEAVIDKDLSAAMLAVGIEADLLAILTEVPQVYVDFNKPTQRALDRLTVSEARRLLAEDQFPPGSMGPKIQAGINFLEQSANPGAQALITSCLAVNGALAGKTGTWLVRDET